jgi:hypothetical protein
MSGRVLVLLSLVALLLSPAASIASAHYTPAPHDGFSYDETVSVGNGVGNYAGYTESTVINGSVEVTSVLANGSDQSLYYNDDHYQNSSGAQYSWSSSGSFAFSPTTFLYVDGTDNQTGYTNPSVWFFIDSTVSAGSSVTLLDSVFQVVSTSANYNLDTAAGGTVRTIFLEGNGSYERNDAYGTFSAVYNWKAYFDPGTGFIIAYVYTETDSDPSGDGFTYTDVLAVSHTSYALTPGSGGSSSSGSSSNSSSVDWTLVVVGLVIAVVVIVLVVVLVLVLSRRRRSLPRHSASGQVRYAPPPTGPAPPPINLTPGGQPAVQQIVIKETVKVWAITSCSSRAMRLRSSALARSASPAWAARSCETRSIS